MIGRGSAGRLAMSADVLPVIPEAFAISIAATRATTSSASTVSSICDPPIVPPSTTNRDPSRDHGQRGRPKIMKGTAGISPTCSKHSAQPTDQISRQTYQRAHQPKA